MSETQQLDGKTPSVISALIKVNKMLPKDNKVKLFFIGCFALVVSLLEVVTASTIVVFGQILNDPEIGYNYIGKTGLEINITPDNMLVAAAILCGLTYFFKNIVAAAEVFFQNFTIQNMNYAFKNKLLSRYAYADYAEYLTRNSSYNCRVVGGDAEQIFSGSMLSLAMIMSEAVVFICLIGLVIYINPSFAFFIFVIGGLIALILTKFLLPRFYWWGKSSQEASLMSWQNLLQFFHAFKEIILLGKRDAFVDYYKEHSKKQAHLGFIQTSVKAMPRMIIEMLFVAIFVASIIFFAYSGTPMTSVVGTLSGYLYAGFRLMPALNRIITQLNIFKGTIPSIDRVYEEFTSIATHQNYQDVPDFKFEKTIELKAVKCRYKGGETYTLDDINLTITKGEMIGIVGETGSGKSTLVDIILGLLQPEKGEVRVDGSYPVASKQWHSHIGYVPQSLYLIDDTIESNIALGERLENIDQQRLEDSLKAAQLEKLLQKLPEGLKTVVGERGIRLSGGERQRVAIARALYKNPDVLIFDEATSALDNETEARLMKTIEELSKQRTVIMVAHRLSTLEGCNKIVELKAGKINQITEKNPAKRKQA